MSMTYHSGDRLASGTHPHPVRCETGKSHPLRRRVSPSSPAFSKPCWKTSGRATATLPLSQVIAMDRDNRQMKRLAAELIGTFILVFAGTAAIVSNDVSGGAVTHVGVSLTFGLVVMAMIYALGDVSGAHLNPAVTLGFWRAGRFPGRDVAGYIVAQLVGALLASGLLRLAFPAHGTLGATLPTGGVLPATLFEFVLTAILMFVILSVSTGAKEKGLMAGTSVGAVIAFEALLGGPISGASMNPARSIAPALLSGQVDSLWIYVVAPIAGAVVAVPGCRIVQAEGCCRSVSCPPKEAP